MIINHNKENIITSRTKCKYCKKEAQFFIWPKKYDIKFNNNEFYNNFTNNKFNFISPSDIKGISFFNIISFKERKISKNFLSLKQKFFSKKTCIYMCPCGMGVWISTKLKNKSI